MIVKRLKHADKCYNNNLDLCLLSRHTLHLFIYITVYIKLYIYKTDIVVGDKSIKLLEKKNLM